MPLFGALHRSSLAAGCALAALSLNAHCMIAATIAVAGGVRARAARPSLSLACTSHASSQADRHFSKQAQIDDMSAVYVACGLPMGAGSGGGGAAAGAGPVMLVGHCMGGMDQMLFQSAARPPHSTCTHTPKPNPLTATHPSSVARIHLPLTHPCHHRSRDRAGGLLHAPIDVIKGDETNLFTMSLRPPSQAHEPQCRRCDGAMCISPRLHL